jgi:acyl-CoA thioesterase
MDNSDAQDIVRTMLERDTFSAWLGVKLLSVEPGFAEVEMTVRDEMMNGFGIAHGGIVYSLADTALAFAANAHGTIAVALNNQISYPAPVSSGDTLRATCSEISRTRKTASYDVSIVDQDYKVVGLFRGMVYRKKETHLQRTDGE